jgi:hypothetical protein
VCHRGPCASPRCRPSPIEWQNSGRTCGRSPGARRRARLKADREALENARVGMEAQKAEAVELADQMAAEIEQLRGRCAKFEERARAADLNKELGRVHANLDAERQSAPSALEGL